MGIDPLYHSGIQSIQRGFANLRRSAHEIANAQDKSIVNVADELVTMKVNRTAVNAAIRVIETADDILGRLIDIRA